MLYALRQQADVDITGLFTTTNREADRVAMHAVRSVLLQRQAKCTGLPLHIIPLPHPCSNTDYEAAMAAFVPQARADGVACFAFGDLFLEDVRHYREHTLQASGIEPLFPLWGSDTAQLSRQMLAAGLRAWITCIDPRQMPASFAGREYNESFIDDLPDSVDACGEYGEFHSFAFAGPMFQSSIDFRLAETVERDGFVFTDLIPT